MKLSMFRTDYSAAIRAVLLASLCGAGMPAAKLLPVAPGAVAVTCNTITGPGPAASVVVKPTATLTTGTVAVTVAAVGSVIVETPPASTVLNSTNQSQGLTYAVNATAGCAGATSGSAVIQFLCRRHSRYDGSGQFDRDCFRVPIGGFTGDSHLLGELRAPGKLYPRTGPNGLDPIGSCGRHSLCREPCRQSDLARRESGHGRCGWLGGCAPHRICR